MSTAAGRARVRRRAVARSVDYEFGPFRLRSDGTLLGEGGVVHLTPSEEAFLGVLLEAEGARVSKDEVAARAWPSTTPSDASLSRCLHTLRRKLDGAGRSTGMIATCYGRGYRIGVPVRRLPAGSPPIPQAASPEGRSHRPA